MIKHGWLGVAIGSLMALAMVGCGSSGSSGNSNEPQGATAGGPQTEGKKLKIGIVFDRGGLGDKSFNDSAWRGIQKAEQELGVEIRKVETKNEKDYEVNQSTLADAGMDLVIAVGLNQETALRNVAAKFPNVKFAIVDGSVKAPNVRELRFKEEEGSFLVGYLAGLTTKSKKLGFVGGMKLDLILKFQYGYMAGAMYADKTITILPAKFTDNWDDTQKAKAAANVLFADGADIVYHAAGRAGLGVITAAKEVGKLAIGVDSDQDDIAPGSVLTSMIKKVDAAVFATIKDLKDGKYEAGEVRYDLKSDGVGTSEFKNTKALIGEANIAKMEEIKKKIIGGEIKVPATEAEYNDFISKL
ncbi:MAG: BMP family ABC transporter substrate-binding protein [Armatimonadetes bacterium]|nr:BMP family ABC transporter substrate-binding protein [Armatimonadota bacterium]